MKIAVGASMKHRNLVQKSMDTLSSLGFTPLFPNLEPRDEGKLNTIAEKKRLAKDHFEAISQAEAYYVIAPDGYIGRSCTLEIGYAIALKKPIFLSEPTHDPTIDCFVVDFISTDKLDAFLTVSAG